MTAGLTPSLDARELPVGLFKPNPENPRFIRDERFESLKRSISERPWLMRARPIIARQDGVVLAGNMRLRAVVDLGWKKIPAVVLSGEETPDEIAEKLVALVDNNEYGENDEQLLAEWLYELREAGAVVDLSGFASDDVERILARVAGPESPGDFPDADPHADYRCPSCGYGWSGHPRPKNSNGDAPDEAKP